MLARRNNHSALASFLETANSADSLPAGAAPRLPPHGMPAGSGLFDQRASARSGAGFGAAFGGSSGLAPVRGGVAHDIVAMEERPEEDA